MSEPITIGPQGSAADYIVDGVHDEVEMQAAIDKLKGSDSLEVKIVGNFGSPEPQPPVPEVDKLVDRVALNPAKGLTKVGLRAEITKLLVEARDSEQNRMFAVMRHLGIKHDAKEMMKVRKEWNRIAELSNLNQEESK